MTGIDVDHQSASQVLPSIDGDLLYVAAPHTSQRLMSAPKAGKPLKGKVAELWRYPVSSMAGE
jgi:hypothetical protein